MLLMLLDINVGTLRLTRPSGEARDTLGEAAAVLLCFCGMVGLPSDFFD